MDKKVPRIGAIFVMEKDKPIILVGLSFLYFDTGWENRRFKEKKKEWNKRILKRRKEWKETKELH